MPLHHAPTSTQCGHYRARRQRATESRETQSQKSRADAVAFATMRTIAGGFFSGAFHLWDNCRCAPCGFEIYCRSVAPCNRNGTTPWNNIEALCKKHAAEHRCWRLMRVRGSLLKHTACFERPAAKRHGFGSQVCFWRLAGLPLQWSHAGVMIRMRIAGGGTADRRPVKYGLAAGVLTPQQ
jgi:hypothetical protein